MTPREVRKNRMIRVEDSLWDEAMRVSKVRGEYLSEVIRAALVAYIKKHGKDLK